MDRRVKERLIGASILVALFVLVVPELLSGPKPNTAPAPTLPAAAAPEPIRNVTVDLTTSRPPENSDLEPATPPPSTAAGAAVVAPAPTVAASAGAASAEFAPPIPSAAISMPGPAPARAAASNSAPSGASAKPQVRQAAARPGVESSAPSPTSMGHGAWSVQLGSFASRANADNLTRQLRGQGFSAFVLSGGSGNSVRYRVRVGPLSNRELAERMAAKLKSLGHAGSLVAPAA